MLQAYEPAEQNGANQQQSSGKRTTTKQQELQWCGSTKVVPEDATINWGKSWFKGGFMDRCRFNEKEHPGIRWHACLDVAAEYVELGAGISRQEAKEYLER